MGKAPFLRHHLFACHTAVTKAGKTEHLFDFAKVPDFALLSEDEMLERFSLELVTQVAEAMNSGEPVLEAGYVLKTGKNTYRVSPEFVATVEKTLSGLRDKSGINAQAVATTAALLFGTLGILYADELAREKRLKRKGERA